MSLSPYLSPSLSRIGFLKGPLSRGPLTNMISHRYAWIKQR